MRSHDITHHINHGVQSDLYTSQIRTLIWSRGPTLAEETYKYDWESPQLNWAHPVPGMPSRTGRPSAVRSAGATQGEGQHGTGREPPCHGTTAGVPPHMAVALVGETAGRGAIAA